MKKSIFIDSTNEETAERLREWQSIHIQVIGESDVVKYF